MPSGNRLQQLVDLGVTTSVSEFSNDAKKVIQALSDDEFNCLLSVRTKVYAQGDEVGRQYDHYVVLCI